MSDCEPEGLGVKNNYSPPLPPLPPLSPSHHHPITQPLTLDLQPLTGATRLQQK
jgi:hypothetical protein